MFRDQISFWNTLSFLQFLFKEMLSFHSLQPVEQCLCVFKPLWALTHYFFRRICFPKLNFQNSEHLITLSQAFSLKMEKEKGWGESLLGLVPVKSDLSGDLFFFWRQIRCSNQAVFGGLQGNVHGILSEANPEAEAHSKGLICPSSLLTWNVSWGKSQASDFFFQWAVIRALLTGWPAPATAKWKQQESLQGLPLPPARVSAQVKWFQLNFSLV